MNTKHLSPEVLNERRLEAVRLRLDGHTVAEVAKRTGLSAPTVSAAWKAFRDGGWETVPVRQRGRRPGQASSLGEREQGVLWRLLAEQPEPPRPAWSSQDLAAGLAKDLTAEAPGDGSGREVSPRAIEHWLEAQDLKPSPLSLEGLARKRSTAGRWVRQQVQPVLEQVRQAGGANWQGGVRVAMAAKSADNVPRRYQLYLHGKRGALFTRCLPAPPQANDYLTMFERLAAEGPVALLFHGAWFQASPEIQAWLKDHPQFHLINTLPNLRLGSDPKIR
ncbi:helix-turn-helix domain-containing protein [Halomonas saccharevitans]|uniref:Helix-turn-helix domain-containing protein n=1 Tax=Halomonas saccharevitans TaxID=416872 RepID=A0ABU3NCQ7_9GAMM|nr:helix-turn-helix domain-containing protein [Halomonas saccharevitans]MDT8878318.1 helix-turn-helix domain-containing protein [Halomonas saccharevitans]